MNGVTLMKPLNTSISSSIDTYLDCDLDTTPICFSTHRKLTTENTTKNWKDDNLCISIDDESIPSNISCQSIVDLPSSCLTSRCERKRKIDTLSKKCVNENTSPIRETKKTRTQFHEKEQRLNSIKFQAVHNETTKFGFTAYGSTHKTLGSSFPFTSQTTFEMVESTFVISMKKDPKPNVPTTPRVHFD